MWRITSFDVEPLCIPLCEPFVVATARIDTTRAALVRATVVHDGDQRRGTGLGEAAALWPITASDQPELLATLRRAAAILLDGTFTGPRDLGILLDDCLAHDLVARAGAESALLFALAEGLGQPMYSLLGGVVDRRPFHVETDITIPIAAPAHMADLVDAWHARGFHFFKIKVGHHHDDDRRALEAIAARVTAAKVRLDGNGGQTVDEAIALARHARGLGLVVQCLEQPTTKADHAALGAVQRALPNTPVIADESAASFADVEALLAGFACQGINLKLVKHGGPLGAARLGRRALRGGLRLMVGAMVETRIGLSAMLHVLRSLDVDPADVLVDLDTAFLLQEDPFVGGYQAAGPLLRLLDAAPRG